MSGPQTEKARRPNCVLVRRTTADLCVVDGDPAPPPQKGHSSVPFVSLFDTLLSAYYFAADVTVYSKDVRLPIQMQRAMAAEAESAREAKAKVCTVSLISILFLFFNSHGREIGWEEVSEMTCFCAEWDVKH